MSERPLLSIVTPCLNAAATIGEMIASVHDQGLGDRLEHVVVDGGSTDGTLEILAAADGVSWVSEPDRGLSDAMNKGVARARGTFIGWMNADDYYLPGALAQVVARLEADPGATWLTAPCLIVDGDGNEIRPFVTRYKRFFLRHHSHRLLLLQNHIVAPSTFVRREALLDAGGFDERFRYSMDYDLWLRLDKVGPPVIIDAPLSAFRMAGESLSMTGFDRQFAEHSRNAREHGADHRVMVLANVVISRLVVLVYKVMRVRRRSGEGAG